MRAATASADQDHQLYRRCHGADRVAFSDADEISAGGTLTIENSTVIGRVHTARLDLASNVIFMARPGAGDAWTHPVISDQNQQGCVRFSILPLNSIVPRRYRCQPDLAVNDAIAAADKPKGSLSPCGAIGDHRSGAGARPAGVHQSSLRPAGLRPVGIPSRPKKFARAPMTSRRWARFTMCSRRNGKPICRSVCEEYLRFGLEAGMFYAT